MIRIEQHPRGRRLFLHGHRIHHWESGIALMLLGAWLVYDDRHDIRPHPELLPLPWDPEIGLTTSHGPW